MGFTRRRFPQYDPASDGSLTMWFDPSDSSKVLAVGGGAITNGATIGTVNTSGGTARAFTQWGANTRPTWDSTGINGLGAIRCNSQILTTTTVTGFASMSGLTILQVAKPSVSGGCVLGFSEIDNATGLADISLVQMIVNGSFQAGGRRTTSDAFAGVTGDSYGSSPFIEGAVFDYANAKLSIFQSGVKGLQQQAFQTAGTTGAGEPHYLSIGGFAQQSGSSAASLCNCWGGEVLVWATAMTADQLVAPFSYLRLKWKIA